MHETAAGNEDGLSSSALVTDGEERAGDGSYNPDEILDTENKVEFSGSNTSPTSVTASTSPSSTSNNPSTVTSISLVKTSEPSAASSSQSERHRNSPQSKSVTTLEHTNAPVSTGSSLEPSGQASRVLCPLCQDECLGLDSLHEHLSQSHKVSPEGRQRLLLMVDIPSTMPMPAPPCENSGKEGVPVSACATANTETKMSSNSTSTASSPSTVAPPFITSPTYVYTIDETDSLDVDKLEREHHRLVTEDAIEISIQGEKAEVSEDFYRCQTCTKSFANIDQLYAHQNELGHLELKQTPRGPGYLCWKKGCNQYFKTAQALQVHFREIHARRNTLVSAVGEQPGQMLRCSQCFLAFRSEARLQEHRLYHLAIAVTQCSICQASFSSVQGLRSHLKMYHSDLSPSESENLQKTIDLNIATLCSTPGSEKFLSFFLGISPKTLARNVSTPSAMDIGNSVSPEDLVREKSSEVPVSKQKLVDNDTKPGYIFSNRDVELTSSDSAKMRMKELAEKIEREDEEADQLEILKQSFPDQQSLEDFINSQAMAEGNYEDPSRKFKCHRCKAGFTKQSYLTAHNKTQLHRRGDKVNYSVDRYLDPNRPFKCDVCKESFTQKNILMVHQNSVSHLHKVKQAVQFGPPISTASGQLQPLLNDQPAHTNGKTGSSKSLTEKKPYQCNLCKVGFGQSEPFENHLRSVGHQSRLAKIPELVMSGQVSLNQSLIEQPDLALDPQTQHLFMEALQQQQLAAVTSQSLLFQTLPTLNSLPLMGMPQLLPPVTTSLISPTTAALASFASAMALESEFNSHRYFSAAEGQIGDVHHEAHKEPTSNGRQMVDLEQQTVETHDGKKMMNCSTESTGTKMDLMMKDIIIKKEVEESEEMKAAEYADFTGHHQHGQKVDVGVGQSMGRVFDLQPSNPTLAASIPIMTARPRGFMGRFKPQVHRNLLENIGFECVMQFNEYSQSKRKEKEKEKEEKDHDIECLLESKEKKTEQAVVLTKDELHAGEEEKSNNIKVDLPEINKSKCLSCGKEFSSVFVLKAHEEEVHKNVVPISFVENFGEKFKTDFEKKQPKSEPEMVQASTQSIQVLQPAALNPPPPASTAAVSVNVSSAVDKTSKVSVSDMPPPPPPPPQLSSAPAFDMASMMPMLSLMPMPVPMNLMSLGIQPPLMPMMSGAAMDMQAGFLPQLGMADPGIMSAQQQMQAAAAAAAAAAQNQKRVRTRISDEQLKILRAHFDINNSPSEEQINQMSEQSGLPQKVIKHWFRNTLFKERQRNKDSPYNFNNPPSTTIDLEEYEKTGRIPAIKVEPSDDDDELLSTSRPEGQESESDLKLPLQLSSKTESMPKFESADERKEHESRSNASTPSNMSSIPTTPTCSAPPTPTPMATPTCLTDAHAAALARETAAQASLTKRANRTRFTDYQIKMLQDYFEQNAYPKDDELDHLSKLLNLSPRVIVVWFQNARQKARKIFENQPAAAADVKESNTPFQRTPSLNYQCKRCSAVFQRYYELIKHQKRPCLSENNNNKPLNSTMTDDDSISSNTSLDDSAQSDTMPATTTKDVTPPSIVPAFHCDKCSATFNRIDLLQEHHKVHDMNPSLFPPFSSTSAFGMLQSLAQQEDNKSILSVAAATAKRKLEAEEEHVDDQPKDKRLRTTILPEQLDYLYQKYQIDCNPSRKQLETIAQEVRLKKRVVQVWFQNTRARERKGHYRAHQQLIHKRCPFCRALFRAKSALESHLATKHPEEMAKGEINVDAIPDAAMESPQPAHSLPGSSTTPQPLAADLSKILSPNSMQPYFTYMPPASLSLGFPPAVSPDPLQLSMKQIYEESYKDYISKLSSSAHPPKPSHILEPSTPRYPESEKRTPAATNEEDAPLDLSIPVKSCGENSESSRNNSKTLPASTSFAEKISRDYERERSRHSSNLDDSFSETQSELADSEYQGDMGSSPPSPRASSGGAVQNKRYRTQMTSLQVRVMKTLFVDYKTPTMAECELLGREIGLPKRVVQVWFQNARAKEKKSKLAMAKTYCSDVDFAKTPEECTLCKFTYSHKFTVQDHIFTKRHIDNVKSYIQSQSDAEREVSDTSGVSNLLRQQSRELEAARKIWDKTSPTSTHLAQLQGLNAAAAFGLPGAIPGLGSLPVIPELGSSSTGATTSSSSSGGSSKKTNKEETHSKEKKSEASTSSNKEQHQQQQQQQQQQQAAELAHMMALGGYLPSLDPSYFSFMYSCLPGYFPSMAAMPILQPGLLPGAEHLMAYDPLSFGTPLPQLQIPGQAIKHVSEKLTESSCTLAQYTQDCKSLGDLKAMVSASDFACAREATVDVGYICKKCQMVYPAREACLTHQRTMCYVAGGESSKGMLKLEQVQYECRVCCDKFSTLYEFKLHCQLETHMVKVGKLGVSHMVSATKPSYSMGFSITESPASYSSGSGVLGGSGSISNSKVLSHTVTSSSAFTSRKSPASATNLDTTPDKSQDAKRAKLD